MMKSRNYLPWCILLIASGALAAGESASASQERPLQVRGVVKTHDWGYDVKQAQGASELVKNREAHAGTYPSPKIVHVPKQEVSDAE